MLRVLLIISIVFSGSLLLGSPLFAQDPSKLKADTPKADSRSANEPSPSPSPNKIAGPLKGGVEHSEQANARRFKALNGRSLDNAPLKSRIRDNSFAVEAQSGFGIIGVKFLLTFGRQPVINRVFPGTPAYEMGLRPNDLIVAVDGIPTLGLTKDEVYDLIIGSPGTPVTISVMRNGDFQVVTCTRMDINAITDPQVRRDYMMSM